MRTKAATARPRFPGTSLSPFGLRDLLRTELASGEAVVGWGMAQREPGAHRAALSLSLMLIPGIGQMLAGLDAVSNMRNQRLVILTGQRLLLVHPDRRAAEPGRGLAAAFGLGEISIEDKDAAARWWVADGPGTPVQRRPDRRTGSGRRSAARGKGSRSRRRHRTASGVARLRLAVPGDEPWIMRIAVRETDASQRLVEALRLLAGDPPGAHAGGPAGDMLGDESTEHDFTASPEQR